MRHMSLGSKFGLAVLGILLNGLRLKKSAANLFGAVLAATIIAGAFSNLHATDFTATIDGSTSFEVTSTPLGAAKFYTVADSGISMSATFLVW